MKESVFESMGARSFEVACKFANYLRVTTQKRVNTTQTTIKTLKSN